MILCSEIEIPEEIVDYLKHELRKSRNMKNNKITSV